MHRLKSLAKSLMPMISANYVAPENFRRILAQLFELSQNPRILVIGCGEVGEGLHELIKHPKIQVVETDVALGPRVSIVCDGHDLPFKSGSFDGVIVQAVLEHVVDPQRCVAEIKRCLKYGGLVYAETPFIQQVHGGRYDFVRYTLLGHRRLFREFEEIQSGMAGGPGMALAWSLKYFLWSFVRSNLARELIAGFVSLTCFWLKYCDRFLRNAPAAVDGASANYFLGRKIDGHLSDRELIKQFRGAQT
ncbi:class I SAM-dependent methyltransferase [Oligoflexus sp.]|uniref:class I SAM-dependent methyltransferase n=1 Tax=Oligoflexus sp. TaxID=1971216 RepID=UPI002D76CBB4|nr:methyltransferase domain-containing protein [Oligoflexus sp.]